MWRKLSHLEGVPKPGCYFGLPFAERSPDSSALHWLSSWLPTLSTSAPCEEEGVRSRRQCYHLWSFYTVSSTELYTVYSTCSSPQILKGWHYPHVTDWELEVPGNPRVPWLVRDGGWTEPRSICSIVTHMRSILPEFLLGFWLRWTWILLSMPQVSIFSHLWAYSFILWQYDTFLPTCMSMDQRMEWLISHTHIVDPEIFTSSSNSYQTAPVLQPPTPSKE